MLVVLSFFAAVIAVATVVAVRSLLQAQDGFEDTSGFHFGPLPQVNSTRYAELNDQAVSSGDLNPLPQAHPVWCRQSKPVAVEVEVRATVASSSRFSRLSQIPALPTRGPSTADFLTS
jgi:hypothetical protein